MVYEDQRQGGVTGVPPIKTKGFFFFLTNLGTFKALQWQNTNSTEAHYESILRVPIMD